MKEQCFSTQVVKGKPLLQTVVTERNSIYEPTAIKILSKVLLLEGIIVCYCVGTLDLHKSFV